ncbi:MAG: GDSL-type esterase/lipase family protein [Planctomycetaceae bacterium]
MKIFFRLPILAGFAFAYLFSNSAVFSGESLKAAGDSDSLQLTLPPEIPLVVGTEFRLWLRNVAMTDDAAACQFEVQFDRGTATAEHWTFTPQESDIGEHQLTILARASNGTPISPAVNVKTTLRVVASRSLTTGNQTKTDLADQTPFRLLIIGDSLTHASTYPRELSRLLKATGTNVELMGTHRPAGAGEGIAHEGYGGWTWARFATHYEPNPDGTYSKRSSPFVFLDEQNKPELNVSKYFATHFSGHKPDAIVVLLGINDCFGAPPNDQKAMDAHIDRTLDSAETVLKSLRDAAPDARIGFCLTPPANARDEAFKANYGDRYTRKGWKAIQHRLVQRQLAYVVKKNDAKISIVPTELNVDPVDGYPDNNGVHPNAVGYHQIAQTIFAWLMTPM